jgi:hypothetical protein
LLPGLLSSFTCSNIHPALVRELRQHRECDTEATTPTISAPPCSRHGRTTSNNPNETRGKELADPVRARDGAHDVAEPTHRSGEPQHTDQGSKEKNGKKRRRGPPTLTHTDTHGTGLRGVSASKSTHAQALQSSIRTGADGHPPRSGSHRPPPAQRSLQAAATARGQLQCCRSHRASRATALRCRNRVRRPHLRRHRRPQ